MAALESRMTTDAPMDDLQWEQEVFDADRYRGRDAVMVARRNRAYTSAARHDAHRCRRGRPPSLVVADGVDDSAAQLQTIVEPSPPGAPARSAAQGREPALPAASTSRR